MLSGERPFKAHTPADTMSAILNDEPRGLINLSSAVVSPILDRITRHCLEKEPSRRFQSARDLAFDLDALTGIPETVATDRDPALPSRRRWQAPVAAGLVGLACGALAVWLIGRLPTKTVTASPLVEHVARITHEKGFSEWPTWSPDSSLFAFTSNRTGNFEVYVYVGRVRGGQEFVNVTNHAAEDVQPAFSPDGSALAFISTRSFP
jgi:serine/threonine protein kinase